MAQLGVADREPGVGKCAGRVVLYRLSQYLDGAPACARRFPPQLHHAFQVSLVGLGRRLVAGSEAALFLRRQRDLDLARDRARHFFLYVDEAAEVARVAVCPQRLFRQNVDEFDVDAHEVALAQHRTRQHLVDAEQPVYLRQRHVRVDPQRRETRQHLELRNARQRRDQLTVQAGREKVLAVVAGQVFERQHGDRGRRTFFRIPRPARAHRSAPDLVDDTDDDDQADDRQCADDDEVRLPQFQRLGTGRRRRAHDAAAGYVVAPAEHQCQRHAEHDGDPDESQCRVRNAEGFEHQVGNL